MPHLALVFEKGAIEAVKELNGEEGGIIRRMVEYKEFCAPKPVWRNSIAHFAAFAFTA
jgi:hypothetical protein